MSDKCTTSYPDEHGAYEIVTCLLFAVAALILILIHLFCPAHKQRASWAVRKDKNRHVIDIEDDVTNKYVNGYTVLKSDPDKPRNGILTSTKAKSSFDNNNLQSTDWNGQQNQDPRLRSSSLNVQFKLDSNRNNGFINIGKQGPSKNSVSFQSVHRPPSYLHSHISPIMKRASSSQELTTASKRSTNSLSAYNSLPNVNQPNMAIMQKTPSFEPSGQSYYDERLSRDFEESLDEGEMQCTVIYDRARYLLILDTLAIQTTLPPGAPGFVVEVTLAPKPSEVVRSKVYVTNQPEVDITLNEPFYLQCSEFELASCSIIITVKPVLSSMIFFAETDLNSLDLLRNGEMYLGGFLKGIYTNMLS